MKDIESCELKAMALKAVAISVTLKLPSLYPNLSDASTFQREWDRLGKEFRSQPLFTKDALKPLKEDRGVIFLV